MPFIASLAPGRRDVLPICGWFLAYVAFAVLGLTWAVVPGGGVAAWPAAGIAFSALVLGSLRCWPAIFLGRLVVAAILHQAHPPGVLLIFAAGATLAALAPAAWLTLRSRFDPQLTTMWDVGRLTLVGAGLGGLISGAINALALLAEGSPAALAPERLTSWGLAGVVGVLTVAPVLLSWSRGRMLRMSVLGWAHLAVCLAVISAALWATFLQGDVIVIRVWHLFPLLVWAAIAFNVRGASLALLITAAFAVFSVKLGLGPLSKGLPEAAGRLMASQQYTLVSAVTVLLLAAATDERRALRALEAAEERARASEQRLRATYEHAFVGICEVDIHGRILRVNEQLCRISGQGRDGLLHANIWDVMGDDPQVQAHERALFDRQMSGRLSVYTLEKAYVTPAGERGWIELKASRVDDDEGEPLYGVQVVRDITLERRWAEQQKLLINELNHRVKNSLATVQSTVGQTLRNAGADPALREALEDRLLGLSRAHNVLTRENWERANVGEIAAEVVTPYTSGRPDRLRLSGGRVALGPQVALAIAMGLQELATNALKYGAWSNADGRVELNWRQEDGPVPRLVLLWREIGGPPVSAPARRGFGSRLLVQGLQRELGGRTDLRFEPDGVICEIELQLTGGPPAAGVADRSEAPADLASV